MHGQILLHSGERVRALETGDLTLNYGLGYSIPTTALVVGQPRPRTLLGEQLFRPISVPWNFQHAKFDASHSMARDARRAMRAVFEKSGLVVDTVASKLQRYGWATLADRDELGIADEAEAAVGLSLNIRVRLAGRARQIVEVSLETDRATIALAAASYSSSPDLDDTLAGGSEWNNVTNGDSRANIRSMASRIAAANGLQIENIEVFLTHASYEAAVEDPKLNTKRGNFATSLPNSEELRAYWGVGRVTVADAYTSTDGVTLTSLYSDVAILKVMPLPGTDFDTREGELDSFVRFNWKGGAGVAANPWFDNDRTSWVFPWEAWEKQATVNTKAAGIIRNTKA